MSPDLLQGKRKREEGEEEEEEKVLPEPTGEKDEEAEPDLEAENLILNKDIAEQSEQEQPLKLVKKTNTQHLAVETGKIIILNWTQ